MANTNNLGFGDARGRFAVLPNAPAQTLTRLYDFSSNQGYGQGFSPLAGPAIDRAGNLYGTLVQGGIQFGTAYELQRKSSGWIFNLLHTFVGNLTNDGARPSPMYEYLFGRT